MSFTSGSGRGSARREFVYEAAGEIAGAEEYQDLRSDRFTRQSRGGGRRLIELDADALGHRPVCESARQTFSFDNLSTHPSHHFHSDADLLPWLCAMAKASPAARLLLKAADKAGWHVRIDDLSGKGFRLDSQAKILILDHFGFTAHALGRSAHFRHALLIAFIKGLRAMWHVNTIKDSLEAYRPEAALMMERVRAGDIETMAILIAWELRGAGHGDVWRHLLGSEEGDMAMIFTRALERDPAGFYDGSVLTRTFCQWYGDETRVAACDEDTLARMDAALGGKTHRPFGSARLEAREIEAVSDLPGGRAYLSGMGANIASDPYFVSMNDAINEAHLFQVVYDAHVTMVEGVPFRDARLARLIFPTGSILPAPEPL